jgi:hypothetical protein
MNEEYVATSLLLDRLMSKASDLVTKKHPFVGGRGSPKSERYTDLAEPPLPSAGQLARQHDGKFASYEERRRTNL